MNILKRILVSTVATLGLVIPAFIPLTASAAGGGLSCGAELEIPVITPGAEPTCAAGEDDADLNDIIQVVVNVLSIVVGVVAVIMIIIGGFKYITSNGDPGAIQSAKNTILYAIIGLIIVALAQVIVRFVISSLNNAQGAEAAGGGGAGGGGGGAGGGGGGAEPPPPLDFPGDGDAPG